MTFRRSILAAATAAAARASGRCLRPGTVLLPHRHRQRWRHLLSDRRHHRERAVLPAGRGLQHGGRHGWRTGLVAVAQATQGSVQNVAMVQAGNAEAGFTQSDVSHWAFTATGLFEGRPPQNRIRFVAHLFPSTSTRRCVATARSAPSATCAAGASRSACRPPARASAPNSSSALTVSRLAGTSRPNT